MTSLQIDPQSIPLGLYLCRIQQDEDFGGFLPSRQDLLKEVQSYYKGDETHFLSNIVGATWKHVINYEIDIYRIKFDIVYSQKRAYDRFTNMFDDYEGNYTDHWFVFTEEEVQCT